MSFFAKINKKLNIIYVNNRLKAQRIILKVIGFIFFSKEKIVVPKNILVFRTCLLGDFLFSVPAINLLRIQYPDSKIFFMTTFAGNKKTVSGSKKYLSNESDIPPWFNFIYPKLVDEIFFIKDFSLNSISFFRKKITHLNPDISFILPHPSDAPLGLIKKLLFFKILGFSKNVYGFDVNGDYSFARKTQNELGLFKHKIIGPIRALKEYSDLHNINENNIMFPLSITEGTNEWTKDKLISINKKQLIIALAIGSIQTHKRWNVKNFILLIEKIKIKFEATFILVGTKNDLELGKYIENSLPKNSLINLIDSTTVEQLAALFTQVDMLIGNDGGAIHLAAAVNCKTISIISGIEYPNSIEPWGFIDYSVRHEVSCSPCYSMTECPLGHNKCLTELPVEKVYDMFIKMVKNIDKVVVK